MTPLTGCMFLSFVFLFGFYTFSLFFPLTIQITQLIRTLVLMQISKSPSGRNTKSKLGSGGPGGKDGIEEEVKVPGKGSRKKFDRKASFRNVSFVGDGDLENEHLPFATLATRCWLLLSYNLR